MPVVRAFRFEQAEYPHRLRDLAEPPAIVYVAGELPRGPSVAIVGTRHPTKRGAAFARKLASDIARSGAVVFSGGAKGIDAAAHEGALDGGGATVVVAPSGFHRPFPDFHGELFERVVERGGAVLSLHAPDEPATRGSFFPRNAALIALSQVIVIVESRVRGGARNAAKHAREMGRPVFAVPGPPWVATAGGCLEEIRLGARLATRAGDVLSALPCQALVEVDQRAGSGVTRGRPRPLPSSGDPDRSRLLGVLRRGPAHPDRLCSETGLEAPLVQAMLLTLTLEGIVVSEPSGRISLVNL